MFDFFALFGLHEKQGNDFPCLHVSSDPYHCASDLKSSVADNYQRKCVMNQGEWLVLTFSLALNRMGSTSRLICGSVFGFRILGMSVYDKNARFQVEPGEGNRNRAQKLRFKLQC